MQQHVSTRNATLLRDKLQETVARFTSLYGPFTLAIFAAISGAIPNCPCKLLAIPRRFESPLVYTGNLKSRLKSQQKSPSVNGP